jgi:hypothetical protein
MDYYKYKLFNIKTRFYYFNLSGILIEAFFHETNQ